MGGISLREARLTPQGLEGDRRYMLVDEEGKFITQREVPKMALFSLKKAEKGYTVSFKQASIQVPLHGEDWQKIPHKVQIWKSSVTALGAPKPINDWFSEQLGQTCSLAYMPQETKRSVPPHYAGVGHSVSFADGYPMLLANTASLDDLNARMDSAVAMNRFRANLIFLGKKAWEEDVWAGFSIGKNNFKCAKPCARCPIVNTNQTTAHRSPQVLKTMATFRRQGNKVLFGINVVWENFTEATDQVLQVGNSLEIYHKA